MKNDEWVFDIGEFRVAAERSQRRGVNVTLDLEADSLDVDCERGSGYDREHITFSIPLDVLKRLLAARATQSESPAREEP